MKKKKFLTIFPLTENVHLTKDVGMIPYVLYKEFGYESTIATYKNNNTNYIKNEIPGVNFIFISKIFKSENLNVLIFILMNFWKFDIVQFYDISVTKMFFGIVCKILNFGKSKIFIKLDANILIMDRSIWGKEKISLYKLLSKFIDVISVESTQIFNFLSKEIKLNNIYLLPNGYLPNASKSIVKKENIFIAVGIFGLERKAHHLAVNAFKSFCGENDNWNLILIGPIINDFENYFENFINKNPHLKNKIIFTGNIKDRKIINEYYQKAKVLLLTSKADGEGFPLVFPEAISNSCLIISSELHCANDVTDFGKFGAVFKQSDEYDLFKKMIKVINNTDVIHTNDYFQFKEKFNWVNLLNEINSKLK